MSDIDRRPHSSRDRDRERDRDAHRSRERRERRASRSRSPRRSRRSRSRDPSPPPMIMDRDEVDYERATRTAFISGVHPKVSDEDLFEFFSLAGRVDDVRIIRDPRTGRSKGLAYVEFSEREGQERGLALNGQLLGGYPITIQPTPLPKQAVPPSTDSMKIYIGSLPFTITEKELRPIVEAFGPVDHIDLHKDNMTGNSKGFGFIQFRHAADAKMALAALDGFEIAGRAIRVGNATENKQAVAVPAFNVQTATAANTAASASSAPTVPTVASQPAVAQAPVGKLEEESLYGGMAMSASSRYELMQKLSRSGDSTVNGTSTSSAGTGSGASAGMINVGLGGAVEMQVPTPCLLLTNMFDPTTEEDPDFDRDVEEDVAEEASKCGRLAHIYVEKESKGNVWLRMETIDGAMAVQRLMHGRWFASRQITAQFVPVAQYESMYPGARR